jgi:hypothetical protein
MFGDGRSTHAGELINDQSALKISAVHLAYILLPDLWHLTAQEAAGGSRCGSWSRHGDRSYATVSIDVLRLETA